MTDNLAAKLNSLPQEKRDQFLILEYAPYAEVFSLASIIVNQGGIGTIAECIRAKKPMLIIPFAGDQFDNADRAARMGVARWIKVENLSVAKLTTDLGRLLYNTQYTLQAEVIAKKIAQEEGLQKALKIINSQL
jgi:UDP:flavonoid glycosyltransferase YjiC (YdhE family)